MVYIFILDMFLFLGKLFIFLKIFWWKILQQNLIVRELAWNNYKKYDYRKINKKYLYKGYKY